MNEFLSVDKARHELAVEKAKAAGLLNSRSEIWMAVNGNLKLAAKVIARAPRASELDHWNLPDRDRRILDALLIFNFAVSLLLYDEFTDEVKALDYVTAMGDAEFRLGKEGQSDYWQFRV